ncbi:hypothetical protein APZ13_04070 [Escherichia coli]|uniref:hypothetical protein n=1 Tax=Escherichia coli TaxID=562 RepID=UPI00071BC33E|nr:hypothetical protein [Escherichia coli]KST26305.1 hypothetical protein APZ13_04070 [Escherichia coli]
MQKQKKLISRPAETMVWQPEFTDKTRARKPAAVHVRQLASNEQEEYIPRKINVGVINTPTLIRSDY